MWKILELCLGLMLTLVPLGLIATFLQVYDDLIIRFGAYAWVYVSLVGHVLLAVVVILLAWARRLVSKRIGGAALEIASRTRLVDMFCALAIVSYAFSIHLSIGLMAVLVALMCLALTYLMRTSPSLARNWKAVRLVSAGGSGWLVAQVAIYHVIVSELTPGAAIVATFIAIWLALVFLFRRDTILA